MTSGGRIPDDELDRLLERAQWPAASDEQLARLTTGWRWLRMRRRLRVGLGAVAVAAGLLLAASIALLRTDRVSPRPVATDSSPPVASPQSADDSSVAVKPEAHPPTKSLAEGISREPNLYERLLLSRMIARGRGAAQDRPDVTAAVASLIEAVADDPSADVTEPLAQVADNLPAVERRLWSVARQETGRRRLGAARLLSRIGTPRSLPVLVELAGDRATHSAAMLGLARMAGDDELARLASMERDSDLRRQLFAMLASRATPRALAHYLSLIDQQATRDEALRALADVASPPVEPLFRYLESPRQRVRLAAALALSRLPDPAVVGRLCASVRGIGRREALIALLLSPSDQAAGCLDEARQNLYLVASVHAAEQHLEQLQSKSAPRGGLP